MAKYLNAKLAKCLSRFLIVKALVCTFNKENALVREIMMGEGNQVASVTLFTFTKRPVPLARTAWAVIG